MTRRDARAVRGPMLKLAVFAVVTLAASYLLAATIANRGYGPTATYRAEFTDVTGLIKGDEIRIAGVRVGEVRRIRVVRRTVAEVTFGMRRDVPLPAGVLAAIRYRNLVGQRYIALTQGPATVGATLPPGGVIPLARTTPALDLTVLFGGFQPLFQALDPTQINQLSDEIIRVLQGEGGTLEALLAHTASLISTLAGKDAVIGRLVDNLNAVVGVLARRDQQLSGSIGELRRLVSGLAADRTAIGQSLAGIDGLAAATADLLVKARPAIRSDVDSLGRLAKNLNDSSTVVDGVLRRLPDKLTTITRTATYGSWFNFYLCSLDAEVGLPVGAVFTPRLAVDQARCR
jgi:phospholipid/cholesterol/gamma-HCH transport system substrate-binding protein